MAEPKIRFSQDDGSFYPEWKEYSISDLFTKNGNKNKDGQNTNVITNSAEFGLIPQRDYFDKDIAVEGNTGNYTIIQTGDFVYNPRKSSYAPMGPFNCYRLEEDGIVSPLYSCLRPKGVLNPEYLLWYFQTDKWYGYVNDHGAQNGARHDRVGMTDKILMGIPVTAPCEEEQQKIADFLSSVDDVITASEEEVVNLETQKKAVMKKIFSQEVRFKRADGTDFPEWEESTIRAVADISGGKTPSMNNLSFWSNPSVNWVSSKDMKTNRILVSEMQISEMAAKTMKIYKPGTVLVVVRSGILKHTLPVALLENESTINQDIKAFEVHGCNSEYFAYYLKTQESIVIRDYVKEGTTVQSIQVDDLIRMMIPIPCGDEQRLIADFLSDFDEAIAAAKKELELWKELKKGLLQQMFV